MLGRSQAGCAITLPARLSPLWRPQWRIRRELTRSCWTHAEGNVVALPVMRHRIVMNFQGEADGVKVEDLIGAKVP